MHVYYDLSRLFERADAPVPSGIDRVDLRYALWTRGSATEWWGIVQCSEGVALVDVDCAEALLTSLERRWILGQPAEALDRPHAWRREAKLSILEKASHVPLRSRLQGRRWVEWPFYASPGLSQWLILLRHKPVAPMPKPHLQAWYWNIGHNFRFKNAAEAVSSHFGRRSVVFLHDVIPLMYPESQRLISRRHFRRFCEWVNRLEGRVLVSSQSTIENIHQLEADGLGLFDDSLDSWTQLPLPVECIFSQCSPAGTDTLQTSDPYFLILGTWEPRKNFELMLDVWERLVARAEPRIVLKWVGRRGAIAPESAKRLKRLKDTGWVEELGTVDDSRICELFSGAQALLFPSLAEGWGLPLAEALAAGLPALTSDLPICREVSQGLAEFLDPSRPEPWLASILDCVTLDPAARRAHLSRIQGFQSFTWEAHFDRLKLQQVLLPRD